MKSSCVSHPERNALILIRAWQLEFCDGNHVAAALMSYFEYWHNIRLDMQSQNRSANDVAVKHGDERTQDESLWQRHSNDEIESGLMGIAKRDKIREGIELLQAKEVLSVGKNPNPRYNFDRTNHYLFHPEVVNGWLRANYPSAKNRTSNDDSSQNDVRKIADGRAEYRQSSAINQQSSSEYRQSSAIYPPAIYRDSSGDSLEIERESGGTSPLPEPEKSEETAADAEKSEQRSLSEIWGDAVKELRGPEPSDVRHHQPSRWEQWKMLEGSRLENLGQFGALPTYRVLVTSAWAVERLQKQLCHALTRTLASLLHQKIALEFGLIGGGV